MYKLISRAAVGLALVACSAAAVAQIAPKDMEVKGTIRTPICTVEPQDGGVYAYGSINKTNVPSTGHLKLSEISKRWTVDCGGASTLLAFTVKDDRSDSLSVQGNEHFGLGKVDGYEKSKIGYFTVKVDEAMVDGKSAFLLRGQPSGGVFGTAVPAMSLDKTLSITWSGASGAIAPTPGPNFGVTMTVQGYIANPTTMDADISAGVDLDGHVTLTYSFGL